MIRRVALALAGILALGIVTTSGSNPAAGQSASTVRIAIKGYENNITPFTITFGALPATNDLLHLVHDSLFWSQVKAEPEPWLAESAITDDDGLTWTVSLRDDVTWHDGTPFTAEDVAFSFDYYLQETASAGRYAHHVSDIPDYAGSEVVDEHTVLLTFNERAPQFKIMPGADLPMLAKHIWEGVEDPKAFTSDLPVGTGPYKLVEMVADQRYVMEANADYFKGRPTVDRLELVVIPDGSNAFASLASGEIDMVERIVPPELVSQFRSDSSIEILEGTRIESSQMYINNQKAPLTDPNLRRAIAMGIDLDVIVDTVLLGNARPGVDSFMHPDSPWALPGATHTHDPEAARQLLDDNGYDQTNGDGVRLAPDGSPLDFSVLVSSFEPLDIRTLQLVSQQLEEIGISLTVETLEPQALRARRQVPAEGGPPPYDMYVSGLEAHAHVDPDALYYFFHSPGDGKGFGGVISGYANRDFDALVEAAAAADNAERRDLLHQAQELMVEEIPVVALYYPTGLYAYRPGAYSGWIADLGHGIFTKRSFLPEYANTASATPTTQAGTATTAAGAGADGGDDDGGSTGLIVGLVGAGAVAVLAGVAIARKRRAVFDDD